LIFNLRYCGKEDSWVGEIEVSLNASKRVIQLVHGSFTKRSDCGIVFVSSVFGDRVEEVQDISYHLSNAGMNHMARFYSVNLGRKAGSMR
jgi:hypothetical protein